MDVSQHFRIKLFIVFLLILSINISWIYQKKGFDINETISFREANCNDALFFKHGKNSYRYYKQIPPGIYTGYELKQKTLFNDSSISDVIHDLKTLRSDNPDVVHTNLYYSILRIWFSGINNNYTDFLIRYGCLLNLMLFFIAFVYMYKYLKLVFEREDIILLGLITAFLNGGCISNLIFIREYYLQLTLVIVLSYYLTKIITDNQNFKNLNICIGLSVITSLTLLCGYFISIYIFFLYLLILRKIFLDGSKNNFYEFKFLFLSSLMILIITYILYPDYLNIGYGSKKYINYISLETILLSIDNVFSSLRDYTPFVLIIIISIYILFFNKKQSNCSNIPFFYFIFSLVYMFLVSVANPFNKTDCIRYTIGVYPFICLIIPYLCEKYNLKYMVMFFSLLFIFYCLPFTHLAKINYIYANKREIFEQMHTKNKPIYIEEIGNNGQADTRYIIFGYLKDDVKYYVNMLDFARKYVPNSILIISYSPDNHVYLKNKDYPKYMSGKGIINPKYLQNPKTVLSTHRIFVFEN